jgi:hypothetical protein
MFEASVSLSPRREQKTIRRPAKDTPPRVAEMIKRGAFDRKPGEFSWATVFSVGRRTRLPSASPSLLAWLSTWCVTRRAAPEQDRQGRQAALHRRCRSGYLIPATLPMIFGIGYVQDCLRGLTNLED